MEIIVEEQLARAQAQAQTLRIERAYREREELGFAGGSRVWGRGKWRVGPGRRVKRSRRATPTQTAAEPSMAAQSLRRSGFSLVSLIADTKEGRFNPKMAPIVPVHELRKGSQHDRNV